MEDVDWDHAFYEICGLEMLEWQLFFFADWFAH